MYQLAGTHRRMTTTKISKTGKRPLRLLVVGGSHQDFTDFRELLSATLSEQLHLEHAISPEDVVKRSGKASYDLLLCSNKSTDNAAFQLLRQVRQLDSGIPLVVLSDPLNRDAIEAAIQAGMRRSTGTKSHHRETNDAPVPGFDVHSVQRRHHESEETLRKLWHSVEQSADALIIMDRSGVMEYVNPAFEALTGYSRHEAVGQTLGILKSEQQEHEYEAMWNTVLSGNIFRGIVMHRNRSGETLILETALTPLRDNRGEITHFISTGRDITERRKLESELQQAQKMDAIGRLAGGVAHDFNNLLLVISAYAELMLDSLPENAPLRRNVGEIMAASRRAADLTRQLLAFGRKQMQMLQVLDLNSVIGEITTMLPRLIGEDIELVFSPGEDLGKVKADPVQIEQVVMNLAANARDAMPDGGTLTIETTTVRVDESYIQRHSIVAEGDYVLLTVTDTGQGIPDEHLAHIFEPFYSTKEAGKGTGLGLATVYGIVKQNGGFVWVYSEPGFGTTFKIYLPLVESLSSEERIPEVDESSPRGSETLLLVEDESSVRLTSRQFLVQSGYRVLEATDGEDALRVSRNQHLPIHLMITDVVMPRMGGPKLAEQLAEERPDMRVLFVSGYAENTVLKHGKIDVATRFLQKPFSLKMLARKIREVLDADEAHALAASSRAYENLDEL
jgi:two-component system, cell cycle sensor histidine kinase and response regulator CckA